MPEAISRRSTTSCHKPAAAPEVLGIHRTVLRTIGALLVLWACFISSESRLWAQSPTGALRIVVIEGENAVNIVQQKTAVAPVVEVRDRNDQPIAGATVRFAIRAGKATFGGPRTLAVTTNSAGRAAVSALTPTGSGAVQISATAAFQGQTAAVTIVQTNVMTAAASGGAGVGGAGAASGGGAAGGGGISATTIGIVGGAVAGGVIVADKALEDAPAAPNVTGTWTRSLVFSDPRVTGALVTFTFALTQTGNAISGTVTMTMGPPGSGTDTRPVNGTFATSSPQVTLDNPILSNAFTDSTGRPYGLCSERYALDLSSDGRKLSGTQTLVPNAICPTVSGTGQVTLDRR